MIPPRIKSVEVLDNYKLKITYINNEVKLYDMKKFLDFDFYKNLKNINYFKSVKSVSTTLQWPNGEDIDPNELYENSILIQ